MDTDIYMDSNNYMNSNSYINTDIYANINISFGVAIDKRIKILNKYLQLNSKKKSLLEIQTTKNTIYNAIICPYLYIESEKDIVKFIKKYLKIFFKLKKDDLIGLMYSNNLNDVINTCGYYTLQYIFMIRDSTTNI